jgi:hypothetical protein
LISGIIALLVKKIGLESLKNKNPKYSLLIIYDGYYIIYLVVHPVTSSLAEFIINRQTVRNQMRDLDMTRH